MIAPTNSLAAPSSPGMSRQCNLRVALAGAGMISYHHLRAWSRLAQVQLVAVCDPDLARAQRRADEFGIPRVYDDVSAMLLNERIDVLDVASPRDTHIPLVEAAAERGIAVICQKPLAPTLAEGEALLRQLAGRTRVMINENWRFRAWYRQIAEWLRQGEAGEPLSVDISIMSSGFIADKHGVRPALERQPFMAHEPRLMIAEVLIHHLDVARWLLGPLRVVAARARHHVPDVRGETLATILLETSTGAPVVISGTMAAPGFPPSTQDQFDLIGAKGSIVLRGTTLELLGPHSCCKSYDPKEGYQASFDATIAHFVACLENGSRFETDIVDNLETLRLVEHAYWAAGLCSPDFAPTGSQ